LRALRTRACPVRDLHAQSQTAAFLHLFDWAIAAS
jgi:hypothetical protein